MIDLYRISNVLAYQQCISVCDIEVENLLISQLLALKVECFRVSNYLHMLDF